MEKRRKFEPEFKHQLVEQILSGEITVAEAAREHQLARSLIERWRTQYRKSTVSDQPSKRERQLEVENEKLKAKIGDLVMQLEHVKKMQIWVQPHKNGDTSEDSSKERARKRTR